MASRQRIWLSSGIPNVKFNDTDGQQLNLCGRMNQMAIDWAL